MQNRTGDYIDREHGWWAAPQKWVSLLSFASEMLQIKVGVPFVPPFCAKVGVPFVEHVHQYMVL